MTTMAEVAKQAGVSMTTVSHVLNGTRRVNEKTIARVHAAIERTGYRPNSIARALAGARTRSIGVAMSGISNPYFMDVISAIEAEAANHGYALLLADTHDEPDKELRMVQELVLRQVDGLVLAPAPDAHMRTLDYLATAGVPAVLVDRFVPAGIDQVGTENERPTATLVKHLADLGHSRIAIVAGLHGLSTTEERVRGYRAGLHESGLPVDDALIESARIPYVPADDAIGRLLSGSNPATALVVGSNSMTIRVLRALRERGLSVPRDIALVGFDDFEWSDLFQPRLTVIAQPTRDIGAKAIELLLSRLDDRDREPQSLRLPATFVHRESCGCKAQGDRGPRTVVPAA